MSNKIVVSVYCLSEILSEYLISISTYKESENIEPLIRLIRQYDKNTKILVINDFSNEQLKETWISNLLVKYYANNDLKEIARLYPKLNDNNLQQLWVSNILIKALSLKKCKIGKSFVDKLENDNLRQVWKVNYLNC